MATARVPLLLEPYLSLPPETSLLLLTSVLGASANWLILRFLSSYLAKTSSSLERASVVVPEDGRVSMDVTEGEEVKVVLVSFMRELNFWQEGGKRIGLDLERLMAKKRFAFVDGLSRLYIPDLGTTSGSARVVPERTGEKILTDSRITSISREIAASVESLRGSRREGHGEGKVVLLIDQVDLLLAAGGDSVSVGDLGDMLLALREQVHSTVLTLSADYPLVSELQTPLEINHAAFLLSVAHQARLVMSLRLLDSGMAKDVSGVISITRDQGSLIQTGEGLEDREVLYFVGGDGSVKVFERGQ